MKSCVTVSLVEEARGGPFVLWDDVPTAAEKAARLGYDAIEIFAPGPDAVDSQMLTKTLESTGLALAAVGTGAGWVKQRLQLADPDAGQRKAACDFVRSMIDFGGPFGAPAIIGSMQGRSGDGVDSATARQYLCDALNALGEYAKQYETVLIYEPLNRYETNQVNTMSDGVAMLESLNTDNVRLLADLFHMNIEESNVADALRASGDHVGHVHFVDSNRRPVGHGHMDMRSAIAALREIGYTGYLSAEAFPYPTPDEAAEQTIRAFHFWLHGAS